MGGAGGRRRTAPRVRPERPRSTLAQQNQDVGLAHAPRVAPEADSTGALSGHVHRPPAARRRCRGPEPGRRGEAGRGGARLGRLRRRQRPQPGQDGRGRRRCERGTRSRSPGGSRGVGRRDRGGVPAAGRAPCLRNVGEQSQGSGRAARPLHERIRRQDRRTGRRGTETYRRSGHYAVPLLRLAAEQGQPRRAR